jgi:glycosyltransferase involved in cell wall biosynthesis
MNQRESNIPKRVLYFAPEFYFSYGARTHAREFFHALQRLPQVCQATVFPEKERLILPSADSTTRPITLKKIAIRVLPEKLRFACRVFWPNKTRYQKLLQQLKSQNTDLAILRLSDDFRYLGKLRNDLPNLKLCVEMNATIFAESKKNIPFRKKLQQLEANEFAKADAICVVSSYWRDYLLKLGVPPRKISVNPNGVNLKNFQRQNSELVDLRRQLGIKPQSYVLGYAGGMESFRQLPRLVDLIVNLKDQGEKNIFLLIIGKGQDQPLIKERMQIANLRHPNCAACVGWQPYTKLPGYMELFDLALLPFTAPYCSPLKLFEYLGMGLPTIGPDVPGVRDVFEDGKHLLLAKQDASNLTELILKLKENPELTRTLARQGQEHIRNNFTWDHNADRVLNFIFQA